MKEFIKKNYFEPALKNKDEFIEKLFNIYESRTSKTKFSLIFTLPILFYASAFLVFLIIMNITFFKASLGFSSL